MMWLERWEAGDPAEVLDKRRDIAGRTKQGKAQRALKGLQELFGEGDVARKLEIPERVSRICFAWGQWASRPNFWADLRITPYCKLMALPEEPTRELSVRLDPESHAVHKAFHRIRCEKTKIVLYAYYVAGCTWEDRERIFADVLKVSRRTFYDHLRSGSMSLYNISGLAHDDRMARKSEGEKSSHNLGDI